MVPVLRLDRDSLTRRGHVAEARLAFATRKRRPALSLDPLDPAEDERDPDDRFGR